MSIYFNGKRNQNKIALTFDDGPSEETEGVLEILKRYDIKATFYIVGKMIKGREHVIEQIKKGGHSFGNHTYSHTRLWFKSTKFIQNEIWACDKELAKVGVKTDLFRFPGFRCGITGLLTCKKLSKTIVFGTLFYDWVSRDYFNPYLKRRQDISGDEKINKVVKNVLSKTKNGTILVLHDYLQEIGPNKEILAILEKVLPELKSKYQFVPLCEFLA